MEGMTPESLPAPPISGLLTVIITTSPTPSAPTTDLISSILDSFRAHCPDLAKVSVIVTFDTYDHIGSKNRLKRGTVTDEGARIFDQYKATVKDLILASYAPPSSSPPVFTTSTGHAEYGLAEQPVYTVPYTVTQTGDEKVTFVEPSQRLGFGLSVRTALRIAKTPYVWVHQHDWTLVSDVPLSSLLAVMMAASSSTTPGETTSSHADDGLGCSSRNNNSTESPPVHYVCFPSVRMLRYHVSSHVTQFPALRALTKELKRDFHVPPAAPSPSSLPPPPPSILPPPSSPDSSIPASPSSSPSPPVCLTPLFFWHDKPHLVSRAHYLRRVFPGRLAVGRGEFIEDRVGQRARDQMKAGVWARWACWLYYPDEGTRLVVRHLNGRIWRGEEGDRRRREDIALRRQPGWEGPGSGAVTPGEERELLASGEATPGEEKVDGIGVAEGRLTGQSDR